MNDRNRARSRQHGKATGGTIEGSEVWRTEARLGGIRGLLWAPSSRERLRTFQARRLRALIRHSYRRIPYYRRLFDRVRLNPDDIRTLDDLPRIPISEKSDFEDAPVEDVTARGVDLRTIVTYPTSGSTGEPMLVRCTLFESRLLRAFRIQAMMQLGLRATDRRSFLLTVKGPEGRRFHEPFGIFRGRKTNALWPVPRIAADLRGWNPHVIRGFPSTLSDVASELTDDDRREIRPRFITTDSEILTPDMRRQIEEGFGAPVFDVYDCYECNVLAWQCPTERQYHVMDAAVIVEVLRDGRPVAPGETGEVVITPLHSWTAPLIRYKIGDLAERGPDRCPCGAPCSCITRIEGRLQDRFVLAGGRSFNPQILTAFVYPLLPNLRRYQIVQEAIDRIVVRLQPIPTSPPTVEQIELMKRRILNGLGATVALRVEFVDHIPSEPNGKFRTARCLVGHRDACA